MTEDIKKLSDFEHARKRIAMYLGSPEVASIQFPVMLENKLQFKSFDYVPAMLTSFKEIIDNSLDELTFNNGGEIRITYDVDNLEFSVEDNGRGIPFEMSEELGGRIATIALSEPKVGRNFETRGNVTGQNGLGAAIVNFCSEYMTLSIWRNKEHFVQRFTPGEKNLNIAEPEITKCPRGRHGTKVEFKLDRKVFKTGTLPIDIVESLVYIIAATNPQIHVWFNGKRLRGKGSSNKSLFNGQACEIKVNTDDDEEFRFLVMPNECYREFSMINNNPTYNGGSHMNCFKKHFVLNMIEAMKRESRKRRLNPQKSDILDSVMVFAIGNVNAPDFDSQSKTKVVNPGFWTIWKELDAYDWKKFIAENRPLVEMIYERCSRRSNVKDQQKIEAKAKALKKKKLANLTDATSRNRKECTLAIFEGHSASSSYSAVRNPNTQASMPLRGKIASTWNAKAKDALRSETIDQICAAVGIAPGKSPEPKELRYKQIQIHTDMDEDGKSISSTLISLFYRFWPELFDVEWLAEFNDGKPFVVLALTPFYILKDKKTKKPHYIYNDAVFDMNDYKTTHTFVTRAKGLGSLSIEDFENHVNNDNTKIAIIDDGQLEETLDVFFSHSRADDRKSVLTGATEFGTTYNQEDDS